LTKNEEKRKGQISKDKFRKERSNKQSVSLKDLEKEIRIKLQRFKKDKSPRE